MSEAYYLYKISSPPSNWFRTHFLPPHRELPGKGLCLLALLTGWKWHVTCNMLHVTCDFWHVTHNFFSSSSVRKVPKSVWDTNEHCLKIYFVITGNPRYLGTKQENYFYSNVTQYWGWKLQSFDTKIDLQACNVSYLGDTWNLLLLFQGKKFLKGRGFVCVSIYIWLCF